MIENGGKAKLAICDISKVYKSFIRHKSKSIKVVEDGS